jgi:hypothetical protein
MKRLVKKGVTIVRDGARVRPEVGKLFDFTKEEVDALKDSGHIGAAKEGEDEEGTAEVASTTSNAETSQAGARGGKKKATANKADSEESGADDDL